MTVERFKEVLSILFGSRYTRHLEMQLGQLRGDYESRLAEHKLQIQQLLTRELDLQLKITRLEQAVLPLSSRAGADLAKLTGTKKPLVPNFGNFTAFDDKPMTEWEKIQKEWERQQDEEEKAQAAKAA